MILFVYDNWFHKIVQNGDILSSTLTNFGSDNGIGCYMIALMYEGYDGEFLFTSDEEIGINLEQWPATWKIKRTIQLKSDSEGGYCKQELILAKLK